VGNGGAQDRSLWRNRDFALLWAGQSVSEVGSQVTMLALPLLATITLHASTFEVALLSVFSSAAFLLVALQAGAVVDRLRKKPILVWSDFARAVLIASIPVAHLLDVLTIWQMYVVALAASVLTVFFDVAYQSYLPVLVTRDKLVEGNSKIAGSSAVAQFAGPGVAGALVAAVGAPYAVAVDAVSFAVSGVATGAVRDNEPQPPQREAGRRLREEIREGLSFVVRHPILSRIVGCTGTSNFFSSMSGAVEIVFLVRVLHASPTVVGIVFSLAAIGALLGASTASMLARRFGSARIVWLSLAITEPALFLAPAAFPGWGVLLVAGASFALGFGSVVYNVAQVSFRQSICPPALQGRMNASVRFIVWGTMPLGGLAGGALGTWIGLRPTLVVAAAGGCVSVLWVIFSPLFGMRDFPTEESDALEALMLREQGASDESKPASPRR
jgi:MFS family permease